MAATVKQCGCPSWGLPAHEKGLLFCCTDVLDWFSFVHQFVKKGTCFLKITSLSTILSRSCIWWNVSFMVEWFIFSGWSDLSCKPGLGTFRALETMSVLTAVSTRKCARTPRALLCQLRRAQLHSVHKSFPKFLWNRIHLNLQTKVISLNTKRNQTKSTNLNQTNPTWRRPYWALHSLWTKACSHYWSEANFMNM